MTPVVLDGGDRRCLTLLLELRRLMITLPPGAIIDLIATDPAAPLDLPAWCHLTGHRYLAAFDGDLGPTYRIEVGADARAVDHARPWTPRP
jgi:tRNA 2-thiouridine synthesizing protein A